MERMGFLR